jgi:nucleotide-binding universal stress UspA family protein
VFNKIVVGYAEDRAGKDAICLAAKLAVLFDSEWTVVFPYQPLLCAVPADVVQQRSREAVRTLTRELDELRAPAYHWSPSSWPVHALHEMALYERADLIVFGAARERIGDRLHVSVMERLIHGAPCAVAIAPKHYAEMAPRQFLHFGAGYCPSVEAESALRGAHALAERTDGDLEAISSAALAPELDGYAAGAPDYPRLQREMLAETQAKLERATAALNGHVKIKCDAVLDQPAAALIERSRQLDLLFLGSRAYGPLRHVLMGSVSARVMRESHCPVIALPRGVVDECFAADDRVVHPEAGAVPSA